MKINVDDNGCIEVVFNSCYGGFGISKEAVLRMVELGSKEAKKYYDEYFQLYINFNSHKPDVPRYDPLLIEVVKELRNKASGEGASLAIGKINLDDLINIENHDGKEDLIGCYDTIYYGRYNDTK